MNPNQDILYNNWYEIREQLQQRWDKLTDEDLNRLSGKTEELVTALRQRYGYGQVQAEIEIDSWLHDRLFPPTHQLKLASGDRIGRK